MPESPYWFPPWVVGECGLPKLSSSARRFKTTTRGEPSSSLVRRVANVRHVGPFTSEQAARNFLRNRFPTIELG